MRMADVASLTYRARHRYLGRQKYPHFLYKYCVLDPTNDESVSHFRDFMIESHFWLSSPFDFNDPFDTSLKVTLEGAPAEIAARLKAIAKRHSSGKERQRITSKLLSETKDQILA